MAINFDLNDLLAFRAVAELSNFRKAAEAVHISQPAFSRRIEKLEQALGVRLLDRTTRRVKLTAVGRDFERKVQAAARRPRRHAARHRRCHDDAHGRGDDRLRAVDRLLLPVAGDPRYHERYAEDPGQGVDACAERGAGRSVMGRARLRHQLHRRAEAISASSRCSRSASSRPAGATIRWRKAPGPLDRPARHHYITVGRASGIGCRSTRRWPVSGLAASITRPST